MIGAPIDVDAAAYFLFLWLLAWPIKRQSIEGIDRNDAGVLLSGIKRLAFGVAIEIDDIAREVRHEHVGAEPFRESVQLINVPIGVGEHQGRRCHARGEMVRNPRPAMGD